MEAVGIFLVEIFKNKEVVLLIIGALISLTSTLIGFLAQTFFTYLLSNRGKVHIYIKSVYSKSTKKAWGFSESSKGMVFDVPLWIELHNTKSTKQIVRNVNLSLYNKKRYICNMIQVTHYDTDDGKEYFGNNGSYSFLLGGDEIKRFDLEFILLKKDFKGETFDEVRLSYYDTKDKHKEITIFELDSAWKIKNNNIDEDWRRLV